jgi:hypothetical protein
MTGQWKLYNMKIPAGSGFVNRSYQEDVKLNREIEIKKK